jgi:acetolactate decarboxylase
MVAPPAKADNFRIRKRSRFMHGRKNSQRFAAIGGAVLLSAGMGVAILLLADLSPSLSPPPVPPPPGRGRLTQVSVLSALVSGRYGGVMPIRELLRYGDFGLGTLDHLDGELVVLGGRAYQVRGDGAVAAVGPGRSTPFAVVTRFEPDGEFPCPRAGNLPDLDARLDDALGHKDSFLAVRVDGRFAPITLRSVPRQEPPYRPLGEVIKGQSVWTHREVGGTLVGVRSPAWVGKLNAPGYHWHFVSADRTVGGHVLDCGAREGRVQYQVCRDWLIKLDPADVPAVPRRALAALDRLLRLMRQRLALMHEVARRKWNKKLPISDPQRECQLLRRVVQRGRGNGLDPERVRSFFAAQLAAARLVQQADFERWQANRQKPFAGTKTLAVLRQRIDRLNSDLIDALAEVRPWLARRTVRQALPQRAAEILTGNGLAGVRETAIAPLLNFD